MSILGIYTGFFIEYLTVHYCSKKIEYFCENIDLILANDGYKINSENNNFSMPKKKPSTKLEVAVKIFITFIPGINIIFTGKILENNKKYIIEELKKGNYILRMSDEEREKYLSLSTYKNKRLYFKYLSGFNAEVISKDENLEFLSVIPFSPGVFDTLKDKLYYDELKTLCEEFNVNYKIGKIEGNPSAIINIPNEIKDTSSIYFESENYEKLHNFKSIDEFEASFSEFSIFNISDSFPEGFIERYNEISDVHKKNVSKKMLEALSVSHEEKTKEKEPSILKLKNQSRKLEL